MRSFHHIPLLGRVRSRDTLAGFRVLDHLDTVEDQQPDIGFVIEEAAAPLEVAVDRGSSPRPADRRRDAVAVGLWLADRRDPVPTEAPNWKSQKEDETWRFSVTKNDLLSALRPEEGSICVWGSWNHSEGDQEEHITISSALVNSERGHSLLRALQTIRDPHGYRIPPSGNDLEIDSGQYQLKGWIWETSREHGIDERDPWSGDIGYPPIRPAKWFSELVGLHSDAERRLWWTSSRGNPVLHSRMWGRKATKNEYMSPETGSRMIASERVLREWLSRLGMNIIIEVQIRREFRRDSYSGRQEDSLEYRPPYTLVVLFDVEGRIETL